MAQDFWGPAPSGKEWRTPHYMVPVFPQCPQAIVLPTLPVFQGTVLLSVPARKRSGTGRLATTSEVFRAARSAIPWRSTTSGHRASSSKYTRGQSWETGSLCRSPGGVGAPAKCVSGFCLAGSGSTSLVFQGDDAGLRTIVSIVDFSKIVWMLMT